MSSKKPPLSVLILLVGFIVLAALATSVTAAQQETAAVDDYTVTRGDTVNITVSHSAPANVTIGGPAQGFEVNVSLDGSGSDTIELDTYRTTSRNTNLFLDPKGTLLTPKTGTPNKALYPGRYTIKVQINGSIEAAGNLYVEPREELTASTGQLPRTADLDDLTIEDDSPPITDTPNVTLGDYAVFTVNESGLEGAFTEDINATELATEEGVQLRIQRGEPLPNQPPDRYSNDDLIVKPQFGDDDRFYVVWDTNSANLRANWNNTYNLEIRLMADKSPLVGTDQTVLKKPVTLDYPEIRLTSSPGFTLQPWETPILTVRGQTNIAPGTEISIKALQRDPNLDVWTTNATIDHTGSFSTTLNLSDADRPSQFPVWIEKYRPRSSYRINLPAASNNSYIFPTQTATNNRVSVLNTSFSHGGFIQLQTNNTTLGVSDYVSSGKHEEITVPLREQLDSPINVTAIAVADANANREYDSSDPPVRRNEARLTDTAIISPSPATTTTIGPTDTTSVESTRGLEIEESSPITPSDESSSGGTVPHSIFVLVVAVALAALIKRRSSRGS